MMLKGTCCTNRRDSFPKWATAARLQRVSLLLAGGDGARLQELTREVAGKPIPKQYCRLLHGSSLLEATLARAHHFSARRQISVIVNQGHMALAKEQLKALPEGNVFVQPRNRDTGPGFMYALLQLERMYPDAIVAAFPTDHYVENDKAFMAHVQRAADILEQLPEKIAILGVAPDRPESGYGYILPAGPIESDAGAFHVEAFTEKPDPARACDIIARGGLWNTFVMVFRLSRMMELLQKNAPAEFAAMAALRDAPDKAEEVYAAIEGWNLSTHFLAHIPQHLMVVEVGDVGWSDWGTRESIERTYRTLNIVPFWNIPQSVPNHVTG